MNEKMKALDPTNAETYKFLGCEQGVKFDTKEILTRVTEEINKRMDRLVNSSLNERNLMRAINSRVVPVAAYAMNVCEFAEKELDGLDGMVKRKLREKNMHGRQNSDERLYMSSEDGGRQLKCFKEVYWQTKESRDIHGAFTRHMDKASVERGSQ